MRQGSHNTIFSRVEPADFVGRTAELERLLKHAKGEGASSGLCLLAVPSAGTSELLRQAYDHLFISHDAAIPSYFEVKHGDETAANAARRFLSEFLLQAVAFRRHDARMIGVSPKLNEIAELSLPSDAPWIDRLLETYKSDTTDERSFVRNCLSAPLRAAANNAKTFVMIDGLHVASQLTGGEAFIEDLIDLFSHASIPFVFAGQRRFLFARTLFPAMAVEPLTFAEAGKFAERLSSRTGVVIDDQTRDLIAVQLGGNAVYTTSLFASAAAANVALDRFDRVEQTYTDEIFGGRIARYLDGIFDRIMPDTGVQQNILRLLAQNLSLTNGNAPAAYWKRHAGLGDNDFRATLDALRSSEIIDVSSGIVHIDTSNIVLRDYLRARSRLEIDGDTRALAVGEALTENVQRAPKLMARFYRRSSAIGLLEMLRNFDGRQVAPALIDYGKFKAEFKGSSDEKIVKAVKEDNAKITLPHIVYAAHTGDFYAKLNEVCDIEASAVALGFTYADGQEETAWIAAEIESKLEANRETTEFWCDRLEMAALNCGFERFKLWLIAPEGFSPEAMEALNARNAYGSSRKQVELLAGILGAEIPASAEKAANEYDFVFPMGDNTEMIAANTVEEIAKRHEFTAKAINQIKTALVEACINATEHSLSPDRKIYQKFVVDSDKITITVSNRGLRLADKLAKPISPDEGRRGWGLKLIKGLMDEVSFEQVDDGTRITMVKYIESQ